jgi:hypothetical protein
MSKVIALIDKDPLLKELCNKIHQRQESLNERFTFLQKQADDLGQKMLNENQPDWDEMVAHLQRLGDLGQYNKKEHHLSFSITENCIEIHENSDEDPPPGIRRFLEHMFTPKP